MAITFAGSCSSGKLTAQSSGEIVFSIECSIRSRARVDVIGVMAKLDTVAAMTTAGHLMPLLRARKVTGVTSGGLVLTPVAWDTTQTHDAGIIVRQSTEVSPITVTGTPKTGQQTYTTRNASIYGQEMLIADLCVIKRQSGQHLYLDPGEALVVTWTDATQPVGGDAIFNAAWEEDTIDAGYTISGNVTLSSAAVSGAKVMLVTDTDRDMPAPQVEVITTGAPGTWSKTLASGVKADVFVQYRNGETLYTDEGKPYLAKP